MPLAAAIVAGLVSALFYLSLLTGSTGSLILAYLAQLPLFAAGLALGVKGAAIAGLTASLATTAVGSWTLGVSTLGGLFLVMDVVPVLFVVRQALHQHDDGERAVWASPGRLAMTLVAIGGAVLFGALLALAGEPGGLRGTVEATVTRGVGTLMELGVVFSGAMLGEPAETLSAGEVAHALTPFVPAAAVTGWLALTAINGVLAQGALVAFGFNRRPSPDMARLTLPRWLAIALAGAGMLAFAASGDVGYVAGSFVPIVCFAYALAGLGVLHAFLRPYGARLLILVPAYVVLLAGWPVLLFACCGIIDQWFGLRRRFAAASIGQGEV